MGKRSNLIVTLGLAVFIVGAAATYLVVRNSDDGTVAGAGKATVLVADLFLDQSRKWLLPNIAAFGLVAAMVPILSLALSDTDVRSMVGGAYVVDNFSLVLILCALPVLALTTWTALSLARGHQLTFFNRGKTKTDRYPEIEAALSSEKPILIPDIWQSGRYKALRESSGHDTFQTIQKTTNSVM